MSATAIDKYSIKGFPAPEKIMSDEQNDHYTEVLYKLERRGHLSSEEEKYAELLTVLIETYEQEHYPVRAVSPLKVLAELLTVNKLKQKDLVPLLGSESMISMVLSGERPLNMHHIRKLSKRFHVSPELFF
jgi:HTH-type transcriptional regulator/antitoxin HigA